MIKGVNGRAEGRFCLTLRPDMTFTKKLISSQLFEYYSSLILHRKKYNVYLVCMRTLSDTPYSLVFPP